MSTSTLFKSARLYSPYGTIARQTHAEHVKIAPLLDTAVKKLAAHATADDLAEFLRAEGITGFMGDSARCPVARWLRVQVGWQCRVASTISVPHFQGATVVNAPPVVAAFYAAFDRGEYSFLEDKGCDCPLCTP